MTTYTYPIMGRMSCGDSETDPSAHAFDAAQALHWYCVDYHTGQWSDLYALQCELEYAPGHSETEPDESAMPYYRALECGDINPRDLLAEIHVATVTP